MVIWRKDGFSYSLINDTKNHSTVVVLSNQRHPVTEEISNSIKAILEDKTYRLPLLRKPFDIDPSTLKDFTGRYSINERVNFDVLQSNDSLFVLMGPNQLYLVPQSTNQFYMEQMDAALRFLSDSTNRINKVLLLNGFMDSDKQATRVE